MSLDPEYILARRVLLDALSALGPQREAVVLVGAQAIYLQVGEADLAVPVMTTDGDLPRRAPADRGAQRQKWRGSIWT